MLGRLIERLKEWERRIHASYSHDIRDPAERKRSHFYVDWLDHGILRRRWHNVAEIAPGVLRSNHPDDRRLAEFAQAGGRTVVNLRGAAIHAHYQFEAESCKRLGLTLVNIPMSARAAPHRRSMLALIETFRSMEKPALIHCKSGADRTGLAAAIYRLAIEGRSVAEARKELSLRFLHIRASKTGVLDHVRDVYEAAHYATGIGFEDWVRTGYDNIAVQHGFNNRRK